MSGEKETKGRVYRVDTGEGLGGVAVSDGTTVAATDQDGHYTLSLAEETGLIWVSMPSGFRPTGPWYRGAAEVGVRGGDFGCRPQPQPPAFTFVHLTDPHLNIGIRSWDRFGQAIEEINALAPAPAFVVCSGDLTHDGRTADGFRNLLGRLQMPAYVTLGNHDVLVDDVDPKALYKTLFGPTYYSFDWGGVHLVILDGQRPNPGQSGPGAVSGVVSDAELEWLAADLTHAGAEATTLLFTHLPLASTYRERRGETTGGAPQGWIANAESVFEILSRFKVRLILQAHLHENARLEVNGIPCLTSGAICGWLWREDGLGPDNADGSPRGYRIVAVTPESVTSRYKAFGRPAGQGLRIEQPHRGGIASEDTEIVVNVYDGGPGTTVSARVDDGPWRPLERMRRILNPAAKADLQCDHVWAGPLEVTNLAPGTHLLHTRADDAAWGAATDVSTFTIAG